MDIPLVNSICYNYISRIEDKIEIRKMSKALSTILIRWKWINKCIKIAGNQMSRQTLGALNHRIIMTEMRQRNRKWQCSTAAFLPKKFKYTLRVLFIFQIFLIPFFPLSLINVAGFFFLFRMLMKGDRVFRNMIMKCEECSINRHEIEW